MSDQVNNYASQNVNYQAQLAALTEDYKAGKIDANTFLSQSLALELKNFKAGADIDKNKTQLEKPSDKALGELKNLGLEALLSFISGENRTASLKTAENRINSNKAEREANFKNTMDSINECIKKAEEQENASWWKKAFGWVASVVTAVVAVATLVVGVISLNPALIVLGAAACYFAASGIVAQATGKGLTERALAALPFVSDDVAKYLGMGIDLAGSLITGWFSGTGVLAAVNGGSKCFASAAAIEKAVKVATYIDKAKYISTGIAGTSAVGSGISAGFAAHYQYKADQSRIEQMELKKALEKLLVDDEEVKKTVKQILEYFQNMTDDVTQVVKDKNNTMTNVMSLTPTGGLA